ncbi:MAG: SusC/RagA family TonB-linked outer membrane protein [Bacteroidetes bacterium]|nr:MAG: SusC/RagA family TonB-linked outer membrane protein [Bacteroidota bacterium]
MSLKKLLQIVVLPCMLLITIQTYAQERTVTGKVTDAKDGSPVAGASVVPKGTSKGTSTGADGTYTITVAANVNTLVVSSVGFGRMEVDISGGKTTGNASMASAADNLGEIVVSTGYGSLRKKDLTGSIATVRAKDFNKGVNTAPDQLIQGKVAGLQITNNNGAPGAASTIRIRGTSSVRSGNNPLIVVDGVPLEGGSARPGLGLPGLGSTPGNNPLNFINPNDIESMDVLKDASSAAIYGSRGSNGVILITTKKGKAGPTVVDVGYSIGTANMAHHIDVLDGNEYRAALSKYALTGGDYGGNVDAMDEITRTGLTQNFNLALSGGGENARQRFSTSFLNEKGIINESMLKKYTFGYTGNFKFLENKKLGLDVNFNVTHLDEEVVPITNDAGFQGSLIGQALQWNPTHPFKKTDGTYWIEPQFGASSVNPLWMLEMYDDNVDQTQIWGYIAPYYKITNDLEYKFQYGRNQGVGERTTMVGRELLNITDIKNRGWGGVSNAKLLTEQFTHTLSYNKQINQNFNLAAVVGYEYLNFEYTASGMSAQDFADIGIPYYNMLGYSTSSSRSLFHYENPTNELQSMFARVNLNWKGKYLFTGTVRRDGSTKFGENNKYATFPSVAAAWNVSNEGFMQNVTFIQNLKIRAGWGQTGNQEFPSGASQTRFVPSGPGSLTQLNVENKDLKWETSTTFNAGVDFQLMKGRINVTADYFNKETDDVLFELDFPQPGAASAKQWQNLPAVITNQGVELTINANLVKKKDFTWDLGVNATWLENMLDGLNGTYNTGALSGQGSSGAYVQKLASGYPLNVFYLREFLGIDKNTGQAIYKEDGDVSYYGEDPNPNVLLGASTELNYKKFTLTMNFNGAFGHFIYNETAMNVLPITNLGTRNVASAYINGEVREDLSNPITSSTRFLEKANFLKCQNARIGYNIGNISKHIKNAYIAITGQNLFTLTDYTGFDPEVNVDKNIGGVPSVGIEYIPFPSARRFQLSINFSL